MTSASPFWAPASRVAQHAGPYRRPPPGVTAGGVAHGDVQPSVASVSSVDAFANRLTTLGVLAATTRERTTDLIASAQRPASPVPATRVLIDAPVDHAVHWCARDLQEEQARARELYLRDCRAELRLLWRSERPAVDWVLRAQTAYFAHRFGLTCAPPPLDSFLVMDPDTLPVHYMGVHDGVLGLMKIKDRLPAGECVATAAHEASHWFSACRVTCTEQGFAYWGCGLEIGSLFHGVNEALTASITHEAIKFGLRDLRSELGQEGRVRLPGQHREASVRLYDTHDASYQHQRTMLQNALTRCYRYYNGHSLQFAEFPLCHDRLAEAIRTYVGLAYLTGDLTIYGMLWHALQKDRFYDLASMQ